MRRHLRVSATCLLLLCVIGVAYAIPEYLTAYTAAYPNAPASTRTCSLCHVASGPPTRNAYGAAYASNGHSFQAIEALDSDGDGFTNIQEINAGTFPGDATSNPGDTVAPTVTAFAVPATASSLTTPITTFTATDNVKVAGYLVTEAADAPLASAAGWTANAPTSFTFTTEGAKTLYAWAKDGSGNVSPTGVSAQVTVTPPDTAAPAITAFTLPATSNTLNVPITAFTATDNRGVTGYRVSTKKSKPKIAATDWTGTAPTEFTFPKSGTQTLYAWVKDAAGHLSKRSSAKVKIEKTAPVITAFTVPATSSSLTVPITAFTATDDSGTVTGYMVTETSKKPTASAAGWTGTPPENHTFATAGKKTLYAWAKDAAGNVSAKKSAKVTIQVAPAVAQTTRSPAPPRRRQPIPSPTWTHRN